MRLNKIVIPAIATRNKVPTQKPALAKVNGMPNTPTPTIVPIKTAVAWRNCLSRISSLNLYTGLSIPKNPKNKGGKPRF